MSKLKFGFRRLAVLLTLVVSTLVFCAIPAQASENITVYMTVEAYNVSGRSWIMQPRRIYVPIGTTALEATETLLSREGVSFRIYGAAWGSYLEMVGGLSEFDHGDVSGWVYTVNHRMPDTGADTHILSSNEVIRWQYTIQPGDLGFPGFAYIGVDQPGADEWGWAPVPARYSHADKTALIRALADGDGSNSARSSALAVAINPRASSAQVSNALANLRSDDYNSSENRDINRGGGSGGSGIVDGGRQAVTSTPTFRSGTPSTSISQTASAVTQTAAVDSVNIALQQVDGSGANIAVARLQNPADISLEVMQSMANAAGDIQLSVNADTLLPGGGFDARLTFNPALATKDVSLSASTASTAAQSVRDLFERHFDGSVSVVSLSHQGDFGMNMRVAIRLDDSLDLDNLHFLIYNRKSNTLSRFTPGFFRVDSNGFLHFDTVVGGDILITNTRI